MAQPESAGIFPESVAQPTHEFELCLYSGGEMNYVSMDESPFSYDVLEELVASNYIKKVSSIEVAIKSLDCATPAISKGA